MAKIPEELRREVIAALYASFDEMQWEERTQAERSVAYGRFVDDPEIGGRLALHIPLDRVRVWIKDGPAKEYRRALEGVGPFAKFTNRRTSGPKGVVAGVLGKSWSVVEGSVRDKPLRCFAQRGDKRRLVVWGPESTLKDLFWHVACHFADGNDDSPIIVVTKRGNAPIDQTQWRRAKRLGSIWGAEVAQTSLAVKQMDDDG